MIALRTLKILSGGSAGQAEARRMVDEKIQAGLDLPSATLTGGLGPTAHGAERHSRAVGIDHVTVVSDHWRTASAASTF